MATEIITKAINASTQWTKNRDGSYWFNFQYPMLCEEWASILTTEGYKIKIAANGHCMRTLSAPKGYYN